MTTYKEENKEDENQWKILNDLYENYLKLGNLINLYDLSSAQIIFELRNICLTPDTEKEYIYQNLQNYELTMDNFVKIVLIYLRIRANVPLILLGETGCGKTSLIRALSSFLRGKFRLVNFNIHSGLSYQEIMDFLSNNKLLERPSSFEKLEKLLNIEKKKKKKKMKKLFYFLMKLTLQIA